MYADLVTLVTDEDNIVAGPIAGALIVLMILAVVFLGFSLTKRLRNAAQAEAEGLYDPSSKPKDKPADWPTTEEPKE